jgi:hypothetical protein
MTNTGSQVIITAPDLVSIYDAKQYVPCDWIPLDLNDHDLPIKYDQGSTKIDNINIYNKELRNKININYDQICGKLFGLNPIYDLLQLLQKYKMLFENEQTIIDIIMKPHIEIHKCTSIYESSLIRAGSHPSTDIVLLIERTIRDPIAYSIKIKKLRENDIKIKKWQETCNELYKDEEVVCNVAKGKWNCVILNSIITRINKRITFLKKLYYCKIDICMRGKTIPSLGYNVKCITIWKHERLVRSIWVQNDLYNKLPFDCVMYISSFLTGVEVSVLKYIDYSQMIETTNHKVVGNSYLIDEHTLIDTWNNMK